MYLRFVSPLRDFSRGVNLGIFQAAYYCRDDIEIPAYLRTALIEEINWFKEYLPSPDSLYFGTPSRKRKLTGICWFKSRADEMISHAFAMRSLLGECGCLITTIGTKNPGRIRYQDDYQIVATPLERTPVSWG